jgi:hypothetical protein
LIEVIYHSFLKAVLPVLHNVQFRVQISNRFEAQLKGI